MQIGFIGLGKLGLPCAAALSTKLDSVIYGFDKNKEVASYIQSCSVPYLEKDAEQYLKTAKIEFQNSTLDVVRNSDLVFLAVQTPHDPLYEGVTPTPDVKKDFDYSFLESSLEEIKSAFILANKKELTLVIISTVLPGTTSRLIKKILGNINIDVLYNPYFIAMGSTIYDFLNPEFVIIGHSNVAKFMQLKGIYSKFLSCPIVPLSYEEAELVKVSYNSYIGLKIIFANLLGEICTKLGTNIANVDNVTNTLGLANNRLISTKYMSYGMGDGGGCHPRDQIAMSWFSEKLGLSVDLFETISKARDEQTKAHAHLIKERQKNLGFPVVILGEAYKKNINLTVGSPSKLLQHYLSELDVPFKVFDPLVHPEQTADFKGPHLFYVATPHDVFKNLVLPLESRVLDPWGYSLSVQYSVYMEYIGRGWRG